MMPSVGVWLILVVIVSETVTQDSKCKKNLKVVNYTVKDAYCDQPLFVTFLQRNPENLLLDNICHTYFPLPDDPNTFQVYYSRVYCDGSSEIISFIAKVIEPGVSKFGSPFCTFTSTVFGYAGCDTYLVYNCFEFGDCASVDSSLVIGLSPKCKPVGLSCLRKVEAIVEDNCIDPDDYFVLPMKLPNRCVTQQLCLNPTNPFHSTISTGRIRVLE